MLSQRRGLYQSYKNSPQVLAVYRVYNIREGFFIAPLDKSKSTK